LDITKNSLVRLVNSIALAINGSVNHRYVSQTLEQRENKKQSCTKSFEFNKKQGTFILERYAIVYIIMLSATIK
jgi:hypothetical protein